MSFKRKYLCDEAIEVIEEFRRRHEQQTGIMLSFVQASKLFAQATRPDLIRMEVKRKPKRRDVFEIRL